MEKCHNEEERIKRANLKQEKSERRFALEKLEFSKEKEAEASKRKRGSRRTVQKRRFPF